MFEITTLEGSKIFYNVIQNKQINLLLNFWRDELLKITSKNEKEKMWNWGFFTLADFWKILLENTLLVYS